MDRNKIKLRLFFWYLILWIFISVALKLGYFVYFPDTLTTKSKWLGLFAGAIAVLASSCKINEIILYKYKNSQVTELCKYFRSLFFAFSGKRFTVLSLISVILTVLFLNLVNAKFTVCFVSGLLITLFVNEITHIIVPKCIARLLHTDDNSLINIYKISFNTSSVISLMSIGFSLCLLTILFHIYKDYQILNGYILGAGIVGIFDVVSLVISKKASDLAGEIVSNLEYNLDEKRNPLSGLRTISFNIFNSSILNSDFTLSFFAVLIASMTIGSEVFYLQGVFFPLILAANGLFASVFVILFTSFGKTDAVKKLLLLEVVAVFIYSFITFYCIKVWFPEYKMLFNPILTGGITGLIITFANIFSMSEKYRPVKNIANSSTMGLKAILVQGIREGVKLSIFPVLLLFAAILTSFLSCAGMESPMLGIWGISLFVLSLVATIGMIIAINLFSCILASSRNFNNISQESTFYDSSDKIEFIRTKDYISGFGSNFINAVSILSTIIVIIAYTVIAGLEEADLLNPFVLSSLVLGAIIPFMFCSYVTGGISRTARSLTFEVKRQLQKHPQILRNEMTPDYLKCITLASRNSAIQAIFYIFVICIIISLIFVFLKEEALAGLIFGSLLSTEGLLFILSNSSLALKGAKKYLANEFKGLDRAEYISLADGHNIIGEFGEIVVPVLNMLIKFMAIFALTLIPYFVK